MNLLKINHQNNTDTYRLLDAGSIITTFDARKEENTVYIKLHADFFSLSKAFAYLLFLTEQITCYTHETWMILTNADARYHRILNGCGYYAKGSVFQRKTDPWRLKLPDRVFDDQGYIIDQGRMQDVPFGWFSTREKGCGWIAAWNLLKMNGIDMPIEKTVREISKYAFLGEAMGADIFTLKRYLQKKGLKVKGTLPFDADTLPHIQSSSCGILLYHHLHGAHYIAYQKDKDQKFHFYNAIYGRRYHFDTLEHFMKTYEFMPFSMALYIPEHD